MIRKPSDTQVVGIHLDGLSLKLAQIDTARGVVKVKRLENFLLTRENEILKFQQEGEDKICSDICDRYLTVANLDGKDTLIRKLKIKLMKDKDIDAALPFEAETALPFAQDEGIIDKITIEKESGQTHLTLLGCKKTALAAYLKEFHDLKLDPEIVATTPSALAAFAGRYTHLEDEILIVFTGETSCLSAIVKKGKLLSSHSINQGVSSLREAFLQAQKREPELFNGSFQNFDFAGEDLQMAPELLEALEKLKQEITWMLLSEMKGIKNQTSAYLLSLGEGSILKGLDQLLYEDVSTPRLELDTKDGIELNQSLLKKFAISIGSALTALPNYPDPINLRQGELAFPKPWKRLKGTLSIFAASSFLLAFLIFLFGQAFVGYEEDSVREEFGATLAELHKNYHEYEKNYEAKNNIVSESGAPFIHLKDLSLDDINDRLNALNSEIMKTPDLYPLWPNVPLVSDVLAWLTNHPNMTSEEGSIKIESFLYQMLKRPEVNKKNEKYQVKVELELSSPSPKTAREFHNALNSPNDFIDPKQEIKWGSSRGKYQTSFYLKDKTVYQAAIK